MDQAIFNTESKRETGQVSPPKVFAQPFRLAFKGESGTGSWLEVRSLEGLRNVFEKLSKGELTEIDRFASVEMQLWGHLAEHSGFLRTMGNASTLGAGIQPLGEGIAPLTEDFSELMGGDEMAALAILDGMKKVLSSKECGDTSPVEQVPSSHSYVKPDGLNLTKDGEAVLRDLVLGKTHAGSPNIRSAEEDVDFHMTAENAIQIFRETPAATEEECIQEAQEQIDCVIVAENGQPTSKIIVGPEAAKVGRLIADVGRGLDNAEDKAVQADALAALGILDAMIQIDQQGLEAAKKQSQDLFETFGVSMADLKDLADKAGNVFKRRAKHGAETEPHEALNISNTNLRKLMRDVSEVDLAMLVGQSVIEPLDPEALAQRQKLTEELQREVRGTIDQTDAYAKGLQSTTDQSMDEIRRLAGLDKPKSNDQDPDKI